MHHYLTQTLNCLFLIDSINFDKFGFGRSFINVIRTLYNGIISCVSLASDTSPDFLWAEVFSRDALSPFLFLLAAEL